MTKLSWLFVALLGSLCLNPEISLPQEKQTEWEKQTECESLKVASPKVLSIKTTPSEGMWIATSDGLSYIGRDGRYQFFQGPKKGWYVSGIALDAAGMPWAATSDGVYAFQPADKSFK